jgi:hypothetical protein
LFDAVEETLDQVSLFIGLTFLAAAATSHATIATSSLMDGAPNFTAV